MNTESQQTPKRKLIISKRWTLANTKNVFKPNKPHNQAIDRAFMEMLAKIKDLFSRKGELCFEKDSRHDTSLSSTLMHTFLTRSLFLELECDYASIKYYVYYDFQGCPFEQEIRSMLSVFPLNTCSHYAPRKNGIKAYFYAVKKYQGDSNFTYLKS